MTEKPPERQLEEKKTVNAPIPFGTSKEALSLVSGQILDDFDPTMTDFTKKLQIMESFGSSIEKRYQAGDRLLDKKGIVWVWKGKNGSQIGEVIPLYLHSKHLLTPLLQREVDKYLRDKSRSAIHAESVKKNRALEHSRPYIEQRIRKDFPEVGDVENHVEFWSAVYRAVEGGYYKYQLAKEFLKGSKITDPALRKQIRDMGFVLINPKTGGFEWFAGGSTKAPVRGVAEEPSVPSSDITFQSIGVTPEQDASFQQQDIDGEMWKKSGLTKDVFQSIGDGNSAAFQRALSYTDTFAKKYPQLAQINKDIEVYLKAIQIDLKAGKSIKDVTAKYQNDLDTLNLQQQFDAIRKNESIPKKDLDHYTDTIERINWALTPHVAGTL